MDFWLGPLKGWKKFNTIRNRWIYIFGSTFLEYDINDLEDFGMVMDQLM